MSITRPWHACGLLTLAAILSSGCGQSGSSPAKSSSAASTTSAEAQPASSSPALNADQVCQLLTPAEVQAILEANPNPTPQPQPSTEGVVENRCVWNAGGTKGDLTLSVIEATGSGPFAMLVQNKPVEGDALSGIGDQAGVTVQGNYYVEVMVRLGPRLLTVGASAVGVAARKDAVIAAARAAVSRVQ